jgi:hypothetical protein
VAEDGSVEDRSEGGAGGSWTAAGGARADDGLLARFGCNADCSPCQQRDRDPALPCDRCEPLLRIPAEETSAGQASGGADRHQRNQAEASGPEPVSHHRRLDGFHRVAPREERRDVLRPLGQALERHRHPPDDQHRQEDALAERLDRRHVVRHRRNHEPQAEKCERHTGERDEEIEWMSRRRHAEEHRQRELHESGGQQEQIARSDDCCHDAGDRDRGEPVSAPHTALPVAHHGGRQAEAGPPEDRDGQQLAHVPDQWRRFIPVQHPERHQEDGGEQVAVNQRHPVPEVQPQADAQLQQQRVHDAVVSSRNTSSSDALCT